jgi:hypothetical protein
MTGDDRERFWCWTVVTATLLACAWLVAWALAVL